MLVCMYATARSCSESTAYPVLRAECIFPTKGDMKPVADPRHSSETSPRVTIVKLRSVGGEQAKYTQQIAYRRGASLTGVTGKVWSSCDDGPPAVLF